MTKKSLLVLIITGVLAFLVIIISPMIGGEEIRLGDIFSPNHTLQYEIFFNIRLTRVLFAFLVGGGLALVGAVFQALLRNDLATPYTLGVSTGGAFGAVVAIKSGIDFTIFVFSSNILLSVLFSLMTISIVYWIAKGRKGISIYTLILAGVALSFFFSAMILFLHYLADFTETYRMVRWLMGSLDISGWHFPILLFILLILVLLYFFFNADALNLILAGEEMALSKGVHVEALQRRSFFLASILVGVIVALAGPIGFVGLIVPHVMRLLQGPNHRYLLPGALLAGGAFLVLCDTLARTIIHPAELPVGVITAIFGGPFFIYLLIRRRNLS